MPLPFPFSGGNPWNFIKSVIHFYDNPATFWAILRVIVITLGFILIFKLIYKTRWSASAERVELHRQLEIIQSERDYLRRQLEQSEATRRRLAAVNAQLHTQLAEWKASNCEELESGQM